LCYNAPGIRPARLIRQVLTEGLLIAFCCCSNPMAIDNIALRR
jgi:hypothetical protein